jgi:uncharacterized protein (TIGR02611 family)
VAAELRRQAWRIIVLVVGLVLLAAGGAMLVLPGPGTLVILAGLAVLSLEFEFARRWRDRLRQTATNRLRAARRRMPNYGRDSSRSGSGSRPA